ncbi:hypothetical protein [Jannaschia sp. R86511]|uniref:hypothetical protein n=1 Tax=Jannaschia sp. R86511 TaxID=3093853 RepID=UPI0036D29894
MAAWAIDTALIRLERLRADDRLHDNRPQVDHLLRDHAIALQRCLHRLYGEVELDDPDGQQVLLRAFTSDPEEDRP